ncbi:MAG: OmcA/MtrC family decaheme c-type cytochrome [Deltaproteobacteria bacterium]|nr:OmcA/MtrC family decaheme c-type cytochrome [Deltaproteobacteria bacterium]
MLLDIRRSRGLAAAWRLLTVAVLGALAACEGGGGGGNDNAQPPEPPATSINRLNVTILDAEVDEDHRPVVRFALTDENGGPRSASDVRIRLVIAVLDPEAHEYRDYLTTVQTSPDTGIAATQAAAEDAATGTLQDVGGGVYRYLFAITLPDGYDASASHRVAIYADVTIDDVGYVSNAVHDFVPAGGPLPAERDIVRTETCNGCHDPLEAHGGSRRDVRLCVTCHSSQITDFTTGETTTQIDPDTRNALGFPELIHKIHRGENLPSVEAGTPYRIVGFRQSVIDFSHVVFPQDIRNCETCHAGGTQSHFFSTKPSRAACGSCHDDVNFASGANHGGGPQPTDGSCSACHVPDSGREFDQSVVGSHVIPAHSSQARGVHFEIIAVQSAETGSTVVGPGEHPVVTFRITDDDGNAIPAVTMNSLSFTLGGSTVEYSAQDYDGDGTIVPGDPSSPWTPGAETFKSESAIRDSSGTDPSGVSRYAFKSNVPPNATGTYVVGVEGYKCATIDGANQRLGGSNCSGTRDANGNGVEDPGEVFNEVRDAGRNEMLAFAVTDGAPAARRQPVSIARCSVCHGIFSQDFLVHGGIRNDVTYCPVCHSPSNDTLSRQLPPVGETATTSPIDFKVMIHEIHRGENLTAPYVLYGRPSGQFPNQTENPVDFGELLYPGDLRDCEACHVPGSYVLSPGQGVLQAGVLPSTTREFLRGQDDKSVLQTFATPPTIAVCASCHDDVNFATGQNHAAGPQSESSCAGCHGVGKKFSVESAHFPGLAREDRIQRPN